jgi:hypothetical protein
MDKKLDIDLKIEFYPMEEAIIKAIEETIKKAKEKATEETIKKAMRLCKKHYGAILHEKPDDLFLNLKGNNEECKGLYFFTKEHMAKFKWSPNKNKDEIKVTEIDIKPISKQVINVVVENYNTDGFNFTFRVYPENKNIKLSASGQDSDKLKDIMDEFIIPNLREE